MSLSRSLNQDFFKVWTSDMAYVLGYFAADGCMIRNARGAYFIEFVSTDRILLEQVQHVTGSNHSLSARPLRHIHWKQTYRIQIGSKEWFQDLLALGFTPGKSKTLTLPQIPQQYRGDFVRGYFDGDGCVYFTQIKYTERPQKRWVLQTLFTSASRPFLESLLELLRNEGVRGGSIRTKTRGYELLLSHKDSLALYRLLYHTAHTSYLFLPRKREKLERAIEVLGLENVRS